MLYTRAGLCSSRASGVLRWWGWWGGCDMGCDVICCLKSFDSNLTRNCSVSWKSLFQRCNMCCILLLFRRSSVESNKPYFPYSAVAGRLRLAWSLFVNSASMVKNRLQSRNKFSLNFCRSQRMAEMPTAAGSSHSHPSCNTPRQISTQTMVIHTHPERSYTFRPFRMNILPTIIEVEH